MKWIIPLAVIFVILLSGCTDQPSVPRPHANVNGRNLSVIFIDVGQGDSILIAYNNTATLIDGGKIEEGPTVINTLHKYGVTHLNYAIVTHEHLDHFGGFEYILKEYTPDNIVYRECASKLCAVHVTSRINYYTTQVIYPRSGTILEIDPDLDMRVLSPPEGGFADVNDNSIVVKITYGKVSYLFMGDAERGAEEYMMDINENLNIDVLKVGHHGSDESISNEFIQVTSPQYAVISVGADNSYGHPAQSTLDALSRYNVQTFRTDEDGAIMIDTDGSGIRVQTNL